MLRPEVFWELRVLDEMIQNATAHYDGETFTYRDICARSDDYCFQNDILDLADDMEEVCNKQDIRYFSVVFRVKNVNPFVFHSFPI